MMGRTSLAISLLLAAAVLSTSACRVDPAAGCASNDDCREGRICVSAVCQFPGSSSPNPGDAGNQQDQVPGQSPIIRVVPSDVFFGPLAPGEGESRTLEIFNDGDATLLIDHVIATGDGYWDSGVDRSSVEPGARPALVEVNVTVGPMPPGEFTLEGTLRIGSNAINPAGGRVNLETEVAFDPIEEGTCLNLWSQNGDEEIWMRPDDSVGLEFALSNCGTVPISIIGLEAFSFDERFIVEWDSSLEFIDVGTTDSVFLEVHSPEGNAETEVGLQVIYIGNGDPETIESRVFIISEDRDNQDCGPSPFAQADRDGPWTESEMTLELGHHIDILLPDRDGFFTSADLVESPDGSANLFQMRSEQAAVLVPDMPGRYEVDMTTSYDGSCEVEHYLDFEVTIPEGAFVAWLTWPEPLPRGRTNDLDFYIAEKTAEGYFWDDGAPVVGGGQDSAEFGDADSDSDNPYRNQDYNNQGYGPELVVIREPHPDSVIAIGAHVFSTAIRGPAEPRVQIWLNGEPTVDASLALERNQFWIAAEVQGSELLQTHEVVSDGFPASNQP